MNKTTRFLSLLPLLLSMTGCSGVELHKPRFESNGKLVSMAEFHSHFDAVHKEFTSKILYTDTQYRTELSKNISTSTIVGYKTKVTPSSKEGIKGTVLQQLEQKVCVDVNHLRMSKDRIVKSYSDTNNNKNTTRATKKASDKSSYYFERRADQEICSVNKTEKTYTRFRNNYLSFYSMAVSFSRTYASPFEKNGGPLSYLYSPSGYFYPIENSGYNRAINYYNSGKKFTITSTAKTPDSEYSAKLQVIYGSSIHIMMYEHSLNNGKYSTNEDEYCFDETIKTTNQSVKKLDYSSYADLTSNYSIE